MKKLKIIFTLISIAMVMGSCSLVPWDEIESLNVEPSLINKTPKLYPGGNAECSTTGIQGLVQTTGRNNYDQSLDKFENSWPSGLLVLVEGDKTISFQIDGSINLGDGKCYKVGAVIVKGSNASNVYDYTDIGGTTMDAELVAPDNSSGGPAALSNLTFCFVECEKPKLFIAVKSFYWAGPAYDILPGVYAYAASSGTYIFPESSGWCLSLGMITYYSGTLTVPFLREPYNDPNDNPDLGALREDIGTVKIESTGTNSIRVTVALKTGGMLDRTYVYAGNEAGLYGTGSCPSYTSWANQDQSDAAIHVFNISY